MRFTGQVRIPEIDHPGIPATILIEENQLEILLDGEGLGRWSLYDVHARRLVSAAFQLELDGEELTFVADEPIDFAYRGVDHMAEAWARIKAMRSIPRSMAVKKSRVGTKPSRIAELRHVMEVNLEAEAKARRQRTTMATPSVFEPTSAQSPVVEAPAQRTAAGDVPDLLAEERAQLEDERRRLEEERERLEQLRREAEERDARRIEAFRLEMSRLEAERAEHERIELERSRRFQEELDRLRSERAQLQEMDQQMAARAGEDAAREEAISVELARLETARLAMEQAEAERVAAAQKELEEVEARRHELERLEEVRVEMEERERQLAEAAAAEAAEAAAAEPSEPAGLPEPDDDSRGVLVDLDVLQDDKEPAMAAAMSREKAGLMGAVRSAFTRGSRNHEHVLVPAPGGLGISRSICRECGYVSISATD